MRASSLLQSSIVLGTMVLSTAAPSFAQQAAAVSSTSQSVSQDTSISVNDSVVMVSGRMSLGLLNGEAHELVYDADSGRKVSELIWDLDNVLMLGAGVTVSPLSWLRLNADVGVAVTEGEGNMDDYDWLATNYDGYTDWSTHDDLEIDKGLTLDLNAEFAILRHNQSVLFAVVGYRHDNWSWVARGGDYIYSTTYLGDTRGSFQDGVEVISYEQTYDTPYIGIGFQADLTPVSISGRLIGSTLVSAEDEDIHHLRNIRFEEDFDNGDMIGVDFAVTYKLNAQMALVGSFKYLEFNEVKGETRATDLTTGQTYLFAGDSAGLDNETSTIALAFTYSL